MVDAGAAQIVMGNHEFNAVLYATEDPDRPGHHLRLHNDKNDAQHEQFLQALDESERPEWIEWFKTLPLWLDLDEGIRVVHACWHDSSIATVSAALADAQINQDEFFSEAARVGTGLYDAVDTLLKGPEMTLDNYGLPKFLDKGRHLRGEARIRWWDSYGATVSDLAEIQPNAEQEGGEPYPEIGDTPCVGNETEFRYTSSTPVVYGHYWRKWPAERNLDWTDTTACVDFSAVAGGPLVAYRWSGEETLSVSGYVIFPPDPN
jgi:hypothetical protein